MGSHLRQPNPQGNGVQYTGGLRDLRPLGGVPTIDRLIEGESFGGEWHFIIPGQRGRLHVTGSMVKTEAKERRLLAKILYDST